MEGLCNDSPWYTEHQPLQPLSNTAADVIQKHRSVPGPGQTQCCPSWHLFSNLTPSSLKGTTSLPQTKAKDIFIDVSSSILTDVRTLTVQCPLLKSVVRIGPETWCCHPGCFQAVARNSREWLFHKTVDDDKCYNNAQKQDRAREESICFPWSPTMGLVLYTHSFKAFLPYSYRHPFARQEWMIWR